MTYNHTSISSLKEGDTIHACYIIDGIHPCTTRQGTPCCFASLKDVSGILTAVSWQPTGELNADQNGTIVSINGTVTRYNGQLQISMESIETVDRNEISEEVIRALVPSAPINVDEYKQALINFVKSIRDFDIRTICEYLLLQRFWDLFVTYPAAKSCHHAFLHGLLMHTVDMAKMADSLCSMTPDKINRDLLIAGVLLHDIGKILEFTVSPVTGLVSKYSTSGNMIGHSVLGAQEIHTTGDTLQVNPDAIFLLEHMVLSHHGDPSCGAAATPMTIEAELLHILDMLDSRREIYAETLDTIPEWEMSPKVFALGHSVYRHALESMSIDKNGV